MYQNKFVVAVKVNGRILRENKDVVYLPFGAEYSILVKNLNASRAKFRLSIDGSDMTSGQWIVVDPNSDVEMERSIQHGNMSYGNRFKFIERTEAIEAHRGIKAEDGLIRVEYQTEVVRPVVPVPHYVPYNVPHPVPTWPHYRPPFYGNLMRSRSLGGVRASASAWTETSCNTAGLAGASAGDIPIATPDAPGITVAGSVSYQQFHTVPDFETGPSDVIVLHLRGRVGTRTVAAPVTVQTVLICPTCGQRAKRGTFCSGCGTALGV